MLLKILFLIGIASSVLIESNDEFEMLSRGGEYELIPGHIYYPNGNATFYIGEGTILRGNGATVVLNRANFELVNVENVRIENLNVVYEMSDVPLAAFRGDNIRDVIFSRVNITGKFNNGMRMSNAHEIFVEDCLFKGLHSKDIAVPYLLNDGTAVSFEDSTVTFSRCTVEDNGSTGHALGTMNFLKTGMYVVEDCIFYNNTIARGVINNNDLCKGPSCSLVIKRCTFKENYAYLSGGALDIQGMENYLVEDSVFIDNCSPVGNHIALNGGDNAGTYNISEGAKIVNCIFTDTKVCAPGGAAAIETYILNNNAFPFGNLYFDNVTLRNIDSLFSVLNATQPFDFVVENSDFGSTVSDDFTGYVSFVNYEGNTCTQKTYVEDSCLMCDGACIGCIFPFFGEECLDKCTCSNGYCNFGTNGDGSCSACINEDYFLPSCLDCHFCLNGDCAKNGSGQICQCDTGFTGPSCGQDLCDDLNCRNTTCFEGKCHCSQDYTGDECEILLCSKSNCKNGKCSHNPESCTCSPGFKGDTCSELNCTSCDIECENDSCDDIDATDQEIVIPPFINITGNFKVQNGTVTLGINSNLMISQNISISNSNIKVGSGSIITSSCTVLQNSTILIDANDFNLEGGQQVLIRTNKSCSQISNVSAEIVNSDNCTKAELVQNDDSVSILFTPICGDKLPIQLILVIIISIVVAVVALVLIVLYVPAVRALVLPHRVRAEEEKLDKGVLKVVDKLNELDVEILDAQKRVRTIRDQVLEEHS